MIAWHLSKSRRNVQLKAGRVLDAVVLVDSFRRKLGWHWSHCLVAADDDGDDDEDEEDNQGDDDDGHCDVS